MLNGKALSMYLDSRFFDNNSYGNIAFYKSCIVRCILPQR